MKYSNVPTVAQLEKIKNSNLILLDYNMTRMRETYLFTRVGRNKWVYTENIVFKTEASTIARAGKYDNKYIHTTANSKDRIHITDKRVARIINHYKELYPKQTKVNYK